MKRYSAVVCGPIVEDPKGVLVLYSDAQAEIERLREALESIEDIASLSAHRKMADILRVIAHALDERKDAQERT